MNNEAPLILTMDFGTQSVRVSIIDENGNVLASEKEKYKPAYVSPQPGYAEQNPDIYYEDMCLCSKRIAESHADLLARVKGITTSCFRDSAVLLDKDRDVIRPMILWLDQRMAKCENPLPAFHRFLFRLVGKADTIRYNRQRAVSNWLIENEPENWAKVDKYVGVSTYFNYRLTGELKDTASAMAGHYPLNFKKRAWYKNPEKHLQGQCFSLTANLLGELVPEGSVIGTITKKASLETGIPEGVPLFASGSDKSCETLGLGVIDDSIGAISYGTASTIETTTQKYHESEPFLPGYPSCIPNYFNMDIQVYRGYWMIGWFLREFGGKAMGDIIDEDIDPAVFNRQLEQVPPGCDGLVLQPYWGPGLSRPLAKGAIIGFSDTTSQIHVYRAIIEGVAYALKEGFEHFEKVLHHKIPELRVAGGGANSDVICQITADVFNRPVSRVQTIETSSLGASIAGYLALGVYKNPNEAIAKMVHPTTTFTPNPENVKKYEYLYRNVYLKIFPSLDKPYQNIKHFNWDEYK